MMVGDDGRFRLIHRALQSLADRRPISQKSGLLHSDEIWPFQTLTRQ